MPMRCQLCIVLCKLPGSAMHPMHVVGVLPAGMVGGGGTHHGRPRLNLIALPCLSSYHFHACLMHLSQPRCHVFCASAAVHHREAALHMNGRLDVTN